MDKIYESYFQADPNSAILIGSKSEIKTKVVFT